jgi:two-component system, OmpR family, KDP operon response regulator KdpE
MFLHPTVLMVAEDLDDTRELRAKLEAEGYAVYYAFSFAEGISCLDHRDIEFLIVSQGTASFEGRSVLERAIEKDRHLAVLVLTRSVDMNIYRETMQPGALDYFGEPVDNAQIMKLVRAHTRQPMKPL